jgi:DNA replication protein DnaC
MEPIGEILARLERAIAKGHMAPGSATDAPERRPPGTGDPACPRCHGVGWLRRDVGLDHPDFGRAFACDCIAEVLAAARLAAVVRAGNMAALQEMTFASFQVDAPGNSDEGKRSLETAHDAARVFAERPVGWLVLHGGFGCGKTHLAAAIANQRLQAGASALFVVVPDLLDHLRAAYAPGSDDAFDERFEAVRETPLLVLDDLGTQAPTPWAGEKLFQLLNYRYNAQLPTVITTNVPLDDLDDRLRSRLGDWGLVRRFEIKALDYRGGVHPDLGLSTLDLYSEMTFQTWRGRVGEVAADAAENLARAFALARGYADEPVGWLVYTGEHGCGKTHLAAAVANHRAAVGSPAMFVVVPDLLDHLRATFSPTSRVAYDKRFEEVRTTPLLVLDDLGTESATPWAREKLFQILNHRYVAHLPTVITMASALEAVDPWLRTRMFDRRWCTVFEIHAHGYHGAVAKGSATSAGARRTRRG